MKIVIDTNVLMSALFFGGLAEKLVNLVLLNIITAVASKEILREYEDTTRDMIQKTRRKDFKFSFVSLIEHLEIIEPHALLPANPDYAGESVYGAGSAGNAGRGGLRDLQRGGRSGYHVWIFVQFDGGGYTAIPFF